MYKYKVPFVATLLILISSASRAEVLHWWRFETGEFLQDAAGETPMEDSRSSNSSEFELPDDTDEGTSARGAFPARLGEFDNDSALEFSSTGHGLFATDSTEVTGDYTIEAFVRFDDLSLHDRIGAIIATQNSRLDPSQFSWMIQVRTDGFGGSEFGELAAWNSDGSRFEFLRSEMILEENTDYYLAGAFDLSANEYTFYLQNLTSGEGLRSETVQHTLSTLQPDPYFLIGGREGFTGVGLIDEIRFSNELLAVEDLLVNLASSLNFDCDSSGEIDVNDLNCITTAQLEDFFDTAGFIQGDATGDGNVAFDDFLILSSGFGSAGNYTEGDFDLSGKVDFSDFLILSTNFGQTSNAVTAVPEPTKLSVLLFGAVTAGFLRRRRN